MTMDKNDRSFGKRNSSNLNELRLSPLLTVEKGEDVYISFVRSTFENHHFIRNYISMSAKSQGKGRKERKGKENEGTGSKSGGTRPLKIIPDLSRREARRRRRQDECHVSPWEGWILFIRSINHYNFLGRPRKNVNGRFQTVSFLR